MRRLFCMICVGVLVACGSGGSDGGGVATPAPPAPPAPAAPSAPNSGAVYVFTDDAAAAFVQQAYIKASNTDAEDWFGGVALSGDTLAVSTRLEDSNATGIDGDQSDNSVRISGAAYVFTRDGAGAWSQQAYIKASNPDASDDFGWSIALSGDTLAVGAVVEDSNATGIDGDQSDNSAENAGAVYVFTRDGAGVWSQQAYIKASNTDVEDAFGYAVALSGDTLAVGALKEASAATGIDGDQTDNSAFEAGAVYVFTRDGAGVWSQQAYIKASNTDAVDVFGNSVALSGDTLAFGAVEEDGNANGIDGDQSNNGANNAGATYVFTRDGAGVWSQQAYIKASNTGAADSGAAYVFTRDGAGIWSQQAYIKASNTGANDQFGWQSALSGDRLAVNTAFEDSAATGIDGDQGDNSAETAGAAYVFTRDGAGVWSQQNYVKASNTDAGDWFGSPVALSGATLAVGATREDSAATGVDGDQSNTTANEAVAVSALVGIPTDNANLSSLDPGSESDAVNPNSNDVIAVAVLGSAKFDATQVDFSTAEFGPGQALPIHDGHVENVNGDDFFDMVFHFNNRDTGVACGDTEATLSGQTFGGEAFTGTDAVETSGCR